MDEILAGCYPFISEWSGRHNPNHLVPTPNEDIKIKHAAEYFPKFKQVELVVGITPENQNKFSAIKILLQRDEKSNIATIKWSIEQHEVLNHSKDDQNAQAKIDSPLEEDATEPPESKSPGITWETKAEPKKLTNAEIVLKEGEPITVNPDAVSQGGIFLYLT